MVFPGDSIFFTALISYLIGAIPFGYLIGKARGVDIRTCGSGNIGATNVTRVVGKFWGRLCFLCDFLKGAFPVALASFLTPKEYLVNIMTLFPDSLCSLSGSIPDRYGLLPAVAAFAAVCGHIWPIYLGFKGGKGISTAAGAIFALNPLALLSASLVWGICFFATRYVSLASILAAGTLPFFGYFYRRLRVADASSPELVLFLLLALLTIVKHRSNIQRLLNGTENRFAKKSASESEKEPET